MSEIHDQIRRKARAHRRRVTRALGVQLRDLDGMTAERLRLYCVAAARCDVLPPTDRLSFTAANTTARALLALERRLGEVGLLPKGKGADPSAALRLHVAAKAANGSGVPS